MCAQHSEVSMAYSLNIICKSLKNANSYLESAVSFCFVGKGIGSVVLMEMKG